MKGVDGGLVRDWARRSESRTRIEEVIDLVRRGWVERREL